MMKISNNYYIENNYLKPDVLVVPDCRTNRDFPSVAAGILSAYWNVPVVDFNTIPGDERRRLMGDYLRYGFVVPSRAYSEMRRLTSLISKDNVIMGTATGPIDVQCCYPFLKIDNIFQYNCIFSDDIPFPDYSKFDTFSCILANWRNATWFYPIMTSLGCPFGCIYCASRRRKQSFRSVRNCIEELNLAKEKWGIKKFVIIDDCFNANIERAKNFAIEVKSLDLEWMAGNGLRADCFDEELAELMKSSGCRWIAFGVESIDDGVLSLINKGESFAQIEKAVILAKKFFNFINVFLILGLPGSSYESDKRSIEWAKSHGLGIHVSFYLPFDKKLQVDWLFDLPEGRELPLAYDKELQLELYYWAKGLKGLA